MISAQEYELASFFGVLPTVLDQGVPWPYNQFTYRVQQGDLALVCAIEPASKEVQLVIKLREQELYEINAIRIDDVRYDNKDGRETLEIVLSESESILLRVRPRIEVRQWIKEHFGT